MCINTEKEQGCNQQRTIIAVTQLSLKVIFRVMVEIRQGHQVELTFWKCPKWLSVISWCLQKNQPNCLSVEQLRIEPYSLTADRLCDKHRRNFRSLANETVMVATRNIVSTLDLKKEVPSIFPSWSLNKVMPAFIEYQIARHIKNSVYMLFFLLSHRAKASDTERNNYLLYVPSTWWGRNLQRFLNDRYDMEINAGGGDTEGVMSLLVLRFKNQFKRFGKASAQSNPVSVEALPSLNFITVDFVKNTNFSQVGYDLPGRIGACISDGISPDRRNNLNWFWDGHMNPKSCTVLWDNDYRSPTQAEKMLSCVHPFQIFNKKTSGQDSALDDFPLWKPGKRFYFCLWKTLTKLIQSFGANVNRFSIRFVWIYVQTLILIKGVAWWYDFFKTTQTEIYMEDAYGLQIFQRAVAMDLVKGIVTLTERSLFYNNYSIEDIRPAHVSFLGGPNSIREMANPEYVTVKLMVGFYFDQVNDSLLMNQRQQLKEKFKLNGAYEKGPMVLVCDEVGFIYGRDSVFDFYNKLADDVLEHRNYSLLIKPKKKDFFKRFPKELSEKLLKLYNLNHCHVLEPDATVSLGVGVSDFVISVPSTAMYIAIASGKKTIVYNPYHTIKDIFYDQGLKDLCIFTDMDRLTKNFQRYLTKEKQNIGDATAVLSKIDAFQDNRSCERMASFLKVYIKYRHAGNDRELALAKTEKWFNESFLPVA